MKLKKLMIIINISFILLLFNSCVGADALDEIAIVQSIGIDLEDDDMISLTLQIYSPQGAGSSTAIDASKNNSSIIKTKGDTISKAIQNATTLQGKNIFTGNNRIVVIGRSFAEKGLEQLFSYFNRSALTRQNTQVLMADGKASDIVGVNIYQGILAAETIEEMINNSEQNGIVYECPYYWLTKNMILNNGDGAMPIIQLEEQGEDNEQNTESEKIQSVNKVKINGTAILDDFKLIGEQDYDKTRGMLLIENKLKQSIVNISEKDVGIVSVKIYNCHTKIKPSIDGDEVVFNLDVDIDAILKELLYPQAEELNKLLVDGIEKECEKKLKKDIENAFNEIVKDYNSDIFNLKDLILKYETDFYKKNKDNIDDIVFNSKINPNINIQIDRIGLESDEKIR